jgi:DNA repair protein RadD
MSLAEEKKNKTLKLLELESAKLEKSTRRVIELASEVAMLENAIANKYLDIDQRDNAVISFISQASCLVDAKRITEAIRVYRKALSISSVAPTKKWIEEELLKFSNVKIKDNPFVVLTPNIEKNDNLRIPQKEAYFAAKRFFESNLEHAIIQLPVGCGKTGLMSILPFQLSQSRVLAIAPNLEIRKNLYDNFNYFGDKSFLKKCSVLSNGFGPAAAFLDGEANIYDCDDANILVTNIQQLVGKGANKWLNKLAPDFFDMILIDEAHHNVADSWQNVLSHFPRAKKLSFTATPMRADGKKVDGHKIYRFPIKQAIVDGYIKDIASRSLEPQEIYFTFKGEDRRINLEEVLRLRENEWFSRGVALSRECNQSIVDASIQALNDLKVSKTFHQIIAVACSVDHAKSIRALYAERNLRAEVIHSNLPDEEKDSILENLKNFKIDAIVQVQMLGEGADYPNLSVAAIFRPFRHLMPYVQFVGRIMRVIKQEAPGDLANRGYVISHVGLNVDRWWEELKEFDSDDEAFFNELALGERDFYLSENSSSIAPKRRRFTPDMNVIEEAIVHFVQDRFVPEEAKLMVDDLIQMMSIRGMDFESLGISRKDLEAKLLQTSSEIKMKGNFSKIAVSPQDARKMARARLDERVRSAAKQMLNELKLKPGGFELPRRNPSLGATANLPAAIIMINQEVMDFLKVGQRERELLQENELKLVHDNMDQIIDRLIEKIKANS